MIKLKLGTLALSALAIVAGAGLVLWGVFADVNFLVMLGALLLLFGLLAPLCRGG